MKKIFLKHFAGCQHSKHCPTGKV